MENPKCRVRIKIWIETEDGDTLFGEGQISVLEAIEKEGSINAAARSLKMGYRSMWGRLKKLEQRIGQPLLIRRKGGQTGGESILTPEAGAMITSFRNLKRRIEDASTKIFEEEW